MIFTSHDRQQLDLAAQSAHGNRTMLHDISSEVSDMSRLLKRLEIIIEQTANDVLALNARIHALETALHAKHPPKPKLKTKS